MSKKMARGVLGSAIAVVVFSVATMLGVQSCVMDDTRTVECPSGLICPPGSTCAAFQDVCISDGCGDGVLDRATGEVCDDGDIEDNDGCSGDCRVLEGCGNGELESGETCDDGNKRSGDGCSHDCLSIEVCGNDYRDEDEACDDGNTVSGDGCSGDCSFIETCGDGERDRNEVCDDGNKVSGDGCSRDCLSIEVCGNGYVDVAKGEECDDAGDSEECDDDCTMAMCGDGYFNSKFIIDQATGMTEQCDAGGDSVACDNDCTAALCGDGYLNRAYVNPETGLAEQCDDGDGAMGGNSDTLADACRRTCLLPRCGDFVIDNGETCDDGENEDNDPTDGKARNTATCDYDCSLPACNDGIHNEQAETTGIPGEKEQCDDGAANSDTSADACRTNCLLSYCGDAIIDTGEGCDGGDNNNTPLDGEAKDTLTCDKDCSISVCGDEYLNNTAGEDCDEGVSAIVDTDGVVNSDEEPDACRTNCLLAHCGDTVVDTGETCDAGEDAANDPADNKAANIPTCDSDCTAPICGDSVYNPEAANTETGSGKEQCDTGGDSSTCDADCTPAECGDGYRNPSSPVPHPDPTQPDLQEQCDDDNNQNTDNCTNLCQLPQCGDGYKNGSEVCDETSSTSADAGCTPGFPNCINNCTMCSL